VRPASSSGVDRTRLFIEPDERGGPCDVISRGIEKSVV